MKTKYEIKFLVKGIVSLTIEANTQEEAIELGKKKMNSIKTFDKKLSYLDGSEEFIDIDNLDAWNEIKR